MVDVPWRLMVLRMAGSFLVLSLPIIGVLAPTTGGQETTPPRSDPTSEHVEELQRCREGIVDPEARPRSRRRWAAQLVSYNSPEARALTLELLKLGDRPEVQRALTAEIADRARQAPEKLDSAFVDPLLDLLGAENADLRSLAAQALTRFPGTDVVDKLGQVASRNDAPLARRLAAIDALAPSTHRREVVAQLIALLGTEVPEITERVIAALDTATHEGFGDDLEGWRTWWRRKSKLTEEAWLAERAGVDRERLRQVTSEYEQHQESARREQEAATNRIRSLQRELFRVLTPEQKEAKLVTWLNDPMVVVQSTALTLIRARMADEGKRPEGAVLEALLAKLAESPRSLRPEVLEIIQNLDEPRVVVAVLAQLEGEADPAIRSLIFRALGKLNDPDAIPAFISEIASPQSSPDCVREAAAALGRVASQSGVAEHTDAAVHALKTRYQAVSPEENTLRAALLAAMAGVGDRAFTAEFLAAVETDEPAILRPAIRGIQAVGDRSRLPRLRTLTAHADLLVRLAAIEAVGSLGYEDADLESLLTRLNPTIEMDVLATDAAWRGFLAILSNRSLDQRIEAADRLRDLPQFEAQYLEALAKSVAASNGDVDQLTVVYDRLATIRLAQNRPDEAVEPLRRLYQVQSRNSDPNATDSGLRLLQASLRSTTETGAADLIRQLAPTTDEPQKARLISIVAEYFASSEARAHIERSRGLLTELESVPPDVVGTAWADMLSKAAAQLQQRDMTEAPISPSSAEDPGPDPP